MPGSTLVVVNPTARHGVTGALVSTIENLLEGQIEYQLVLSERPGHALELAAQAEGFDAVIAVGGDGTVNEVLNGLMRIPRDRRPALALLPTGSGNDYRRTLGISKELSTAIKQYVGGKRTSIDLGIVNEMYFANSVAIGFDARVTAKAAELKMTTGWSGILLYLRAFFAVVFRRFSTYRVELSLDNGPAEDRDLLLIAATNGPTYGGGFRITPDAIPDDGLLEVCIISRMSILGALWRLPFLIIGAHGWMKPVTFARHRSVVVKSELPIECQFDGEVMLACSYEIEILPGGLDVIVPDRW